MEKDYVKKIKALYIISEILYVPLSQKLFVKRCNHPKTSDIGNSSSHKQSRLLHIIREFIC